MRRNDGTVHPGHNRHESGLALRDCIKTYLVSNVQTPGDESIGSKHWNFVRGALNQILNAFTDANIELALTCELWIVVTDMPFECMPSPT